MVKGLAILVGLIFIAIGILGFIPGVTPTEMLFNTFHVNSIHNLVHIISGIIFVFAGLVGPGAARVWFQIFGVIYAIIAIWGFAVGNGNTVWIISNNPPDTWLHSVLAVFFLLVGFGSSRQATG